MAVGARVDRGDAWPAKAESDGDCQQRERVGEAGLAVGVHRVPCVCQRTIYSVHQLRARVCV